MKRISLLVLVVAGCGSSSSKTPDAAVHIDAPADTASHDAPADGHADASIDAAMGSGAHTHYVINRITMPTSSNESRADGFDLNGDGTVDNQMGAALAAMTSQGFDVQTPIDTAVAHGASITLADLQATALTSATDAGFTLFSGTNPNPMPCNGVNDTTCGHHLTGTGSFDVAAMPRDTPIIGTIASSVYTGGPGHLSVPLYAFTSTPATVTLLAAHAQFTASANGLMTGKIGGAISTDDINNKVYPGMQTGIMAVITRDCTNLQSPPGCGCAQNSSGATMVSFFDTDHDCAVSLTEIKNNSLIQALFAPDVTVEGQTALSFGFAFTAVDATFTP